MTVTAIRIHRRCVLATSALSLAIAPAIAADAQASVRDPLPSWRDGPNKRAILELARAVARRGSSDYLPPEERIAVFDNDGTLWVEQPLYTQFVFAIDRLREMARRDPALAEREPMRAAIAGDLGAVMAGGEKALAEIIAVTHSGMSQAAFLDIARQWLATARHPRFDRPYTRLVYQPMLEAMAFLRARGFQTFIVSGGGVEFIRAFSEEAYGIPPWQVIGSTFDLRMSLLDGKVNLTRMPAVDFVDDGPGKPVGIARQVGKRPVIAFGNSDGDFEMLQYTTEAPGRRLGVIVRHDDAEREYAYDKDTQVGRLSRALDAAPHRKWLVVSMRTDWAKVFP